MDDNAVLMDSPRHNSGAAFFAEMAQNGTDHYKDVDVLFPIFDGKRNSQGPTWEAGARYDRVDALVARAGRSVKEPIVRDSSFRGGFETSVFDQEHSK